MKNSLLTQMKGSGSCNTTPFFEPEDFIRVGTQSVNSFGTAASMFHDFLHLPLPGDGCRAVFPWWPAGVAWIQLPHRLPCAAAHATTDRGVGIVVGGGAQLVGPRRDGELLAFGAALVRTVAVLGRCNRNLDVSFTVARIPHGRFVIILVLIRIVHRILHPSRIHTSPSLGESAV